MKIITDSKEAKAIIKKYKNKEIMTIDESKEWFSAISFFEFYKEFDMELDEYEIKEA